jgi:hypothetical protein
MVQSIKSAARENYRQRRSRYSLQQRDRQPNGSRTTVNLDNEQASRSLSDSQMTTLLTDDVGGDPYAPAPSPPIEYQQAPGVASESQRESADRSAGDELAAGLLRTILGEESAQLEKMDLSAANYSERVMDYIDLVFSRQFEFYVTYVTETMSSGRGWLLKLFMESPCVFQTSTSMVACYRACDDIGQIIPHEDYLREIDREHQFGMQVLRRELQRLPSTHGIDYVRKTIEVFICMLQCVSFEVRAMFWLASNRSTTPYTSVLTRPSLLC